jgi:hypothetical protein
MTLDCALNLVWALFAAGTLAAFMAAEWRSRRGALAPRLRRSLALVIVLIAIFPTVSATDDVIHLRSLEFGIPAPQQVRKQSSAGPADSSALYLARLSDAFQNVRVSFLSWPVAAWYCVPLAGLPSVASHDRFLPSPATRAPPRCSLPS